MIGEFLSQYLVLSKLGAGGMGEVYLAEDQNLKRQVALKVMPPEMAEDPERLIRFQREAEAVAALNHPNIVTIHNIEEIQGKRILIMELVEGHSLDRILSPGGLPLPGCPGHRRSAGQSADGGPREGHCASRPEARQHHDPS